MEKPEIQPESPPPRADFMGLPLTRTTPRELTAWIAAAARSRTAPVKISYLNAATTNLALNDPEQGARVGRFDCLYADGKAVVWAARWLGHALPERVNAGDFTAEFFEAIRDAGLRAALIGGEPGVAERFAATHRAGTPGLQIALVRDGFFADAETLRTELETADPDLVLVGMGSPRQEALVQDWSARGRPRVWWCVGALFEYDAGERRRAPVWMRRAGLEWAVRLALEPKRLWRRYLFGNPRFVARVLAAKWKQRRA